VHRSGLSCTAEAKHEACSEVWRLAEDVLLVHKRIGETIADFEFLIEESFAFDLKKKKLLLLFAGIPSSFSRCPCLCTHIGCADVRTRIWSSARATAAEM